MTATVKATVVIGDKTITFEGPQDFVEAQVARFAAEQNASMTHSKGSGLSAGAGGDLSRMSERDMIAAKRPRNHPETVAVLAFGLTQNGMEEFTEDDIRRAYVRAAIRPPKVIAQAIRDAKNNFDYLEAGKERGTYRLSSHGDRTVRFDLPAKD